MKALKILLIMVLGLAFLMFSCACGSTDDTVGIPSDTETKETVYTVTIVDDDNQPVPGVLLQLCLESCYPNKTDESGMAEFVSLPSGNYKVSLMSIPEGYDYATKEREWYFPDGESSLTIVLSKVP